MRWRGPQEAMGKRWGRSFCFLVFFNLANKQAHFDTYMKLKPENYSTDTGKLQAQVQSVGPVCCSLDITATKAIDLIFVLGGAATGGAFSTFMFLKNHLGFQMKRNLWENLP
jgi:hypothetical protein